jgi:hypothetical protein
VTVPEPTRLLADIAGLAAACPIDAGVLGEYAFVARQRGADLAADLYPRVIAHLRTGCAECQVNLERLDGLARRGGSSASQSPGGPGASETPGEAAPPSEQVTASAAQAAPAEPIEIASAVALARAIESEHEALRKPLPPDRSGQVDARRSSHRRRHLLLVEAGLVRQRLAARRLFVERIGAALAGPSRPVNPKAGLMLDDLAGQVDDLGRLVGRLGRALTDLHRLGDVPRGPARSQAEALVERGLGLTREALAVDRRLARLQGPLAGMVMGVRG